MKRCSLFLTVILLFLPRNFFCEAKYSLPSVSAKYSYSALTVKAAWKIPQTEFSENPEILLPAWGASLDFSDLYRTETEKIKFSAIFGTVSPSGSILKMKNPALSTSAGAVQNSFSDAAILYTSLPGSANCEKPLGFGTSLKFETNSVLKKLNLTLFSDEKDNFLESALLQLQTGKKSHISISTTSGQFLKSNTTSKWFNATKLFPETQFFATNFQASFISPHFKTKETANLFYEKNFFNSPQATFSSENQIKFRDFLLNFAFFCVSEKEIFTASSARQKTLSQIKINPVFTFYPFNKFKIQGGALCLLEQKIQTDESVEIEKKLGGQINLFTQRTFSKINVFAEGIDSAEKISGAFSHSFYGFLNPVETISFAFTPESEKLRLKCSQKISFRGKTFSGSLTAGATSYIIKKALETFSAEIKMSCTFKAENIFISANAGLLFNII